ADIWPRRGEKLDLWCATGRSDEPAFLPGIVRGVCNIRGMRVRGCHYSHEANIVMKRFALILLCIFVSGCARQPEINYGEVPDFTLTDQDGKSLTRADLAGKVWIADFIFTNCAGTCPMITSTMHRLQGALPAEVHFVSFSVDPER